MITKAIVEEVVDQNRVRVRIPIIHKISTSASATPFKELPVATICTLPGIEVHYAIGEVVYVAYENDISSDLVVLGQLSVNFGTDSYSIIQSEIDGNTSTILPRQSSGKVEQQALRTGELLYSSKNNALFYGVPQNMKKQIVTYDMLQSCLLQLKDDIMKEVNSDNT